jgi:hypothetical protein
MKHLRDLLGGINGWVEAGIPGSRTTLPRSGARLRELGDLTRVELAVVWRDSSQSGRLSGAPFAQNRHSRTIDPRHPLGERHQREPHESTS